MNHPIMQNLPPPRPGFMDLRTRSAENVNDPNSIPRPNPSPRVEHFDGDIPPAMSPLDMFAAQSRLLAKQLDDSKRDGRRVSRLPPLTTTDPITKQQSIYHRSSSVGQRELDEPTLPGRIGQRNVKEVKETREPSGNLPGLQEPQFRPKSFYPRMSHIPPEEDDEVEVEEAPGEGGNHMWGRGQHRKTASIISEEQTFMTPVEYRSSEALDLMSPSSMTSPLSAVGPGLPYPSHFEPLAAPPPLPTHPPPSRPPRFPPNSRAQEGMPQQPPPRFMPELQRGASNDSTSNSSSKGQPALAPSKSPHAKQGSSIRSIPVDSSDDENSASTAGSGFSRNRKLSSSSNVSLPASPFPPFAQAAHGRSPSLNSEYSVNGTRLPRPAFNFSRPLSRASQPSFDVPRQPEFDHRPSVDQIRPPFTMEHRQHSADSQGFLFMEDGFSTPMSMETEQPVDGHDGTDAPAPSYIYAKFSLPRGRMLSRDSRVLQNADLPHFEWERPHTQSNVQPMGPYANAPMSPPSLPMSPPSSLPMSPPSPSPLRDSPRPSIDMHRPSIDVHRGSPRPSAERNRLISPTRPSGEQRRRFHSPNPSIDLRRQQPSPRPSMEQAQRPTLHQRTPSRSQVASIVTNDTASEYTESTRSGSTIKARPHHTKAPSIDMTAEDHLAKGIALHEKGESRESTYHLRIAAKQNLPTAMLLYALACRHGWGMRPNPSEGVQWLRRAADCASHEIAMDGSSQGQTAAGPPEAAQDRKTKRAQFALSIYELGQSHYNGWGIEQDRALALRCFEIAANWGDADAMAEAGFCYAKGEGCKKDLKKAARYYRMAEAKGMSMVGNSWIWKPKYADDGADKSSNGDNQERAGRGAARDSTGGKGRDKSRTRTIFGRKKSVGTQ